MVWTILGGLVLIIIGAEAILRGAGTIKRHLRLPAFMIGLLLVGFGTSLPELAIATGATLQRFENLAVGLIIGSNILNLTVLLGVCALFKSVTVDRRAVGRDGIFMLLGAAIILLVALFKPTSLLWALGCLLLLAGYMIWIYTHEKKTSDPGLMEKKAGYVGRGPEQLVYAGILIAIGAFMIVYGSGLLIEGSVSYATDIGVSEALIGLVLVAIFTSAPELIISVHATINHRDDVAVGNLLGSTIFNSLAIFPLCAFLMPVGVSLVAGPWIIHAVVNMAVSLTAFFFIYTGRCIERREGVVLLGSYVIYILYLFLGFPTF